MSLSRVVIGGYKMKHHLGEGSFGTVFCAVRADTGKSVAVKFVVAAADPRSILITYLIND